MKFIATRVNHGEELLQLRDPNFFGAAVNGTVCPLLCRSDFVIKKHPYEGISHNQEACRKMCLCRDGMDSRPKGCIHADYWSNNIIEDT